MNQNDIYMDSLKMEDIPWIRLATPYGRAEKFPEYFQKLYSKDKEILDNNLKNIKWNIEHQDTLWPVTPIALVFLVRIFEEKFTEADENIISVYLCEKLLELFILVAKAYHYANEMEHEQPVSTFADMLSSDSLWPDVPEDYDEEADLELYEESPFSDELFYSFYYYSYVVLQRMKPLLYKVQDESMKEKAGKLKELLNSETV